MISGKTPAMRMAWALLALAAPSANAGMVFGPYLIWMNFAGDPTAD
jgi:tryptophan-rich sensory protein